MRRRDAEDVTRRRLAPVHLTALSRGRSFRVARMREQSERRLRLTPVPLPEERARTYHLLHCCLVAFRWRLVAFGSSSFNRTGAGWGITHLVRRRRVAVEV
jgi:hypothetical protein